MAEPITLAVVGAAVLTEGIKFLYEQAGEVLKRWRDRQSEANKEGEAQPQSTVVLQGKIPKIFEGRLAQPMIHFEVMPRLAEPLRELKKDLSDYADGTESVDPTSEHLLQKVDALRQILEVIYQQRITFQGEHRSPSGPAVIARLDVERIAGDVTVVRAKNVVDGTVTAEAKAKDVEAGGQFIVVDIDDTIGR